MGKLISAIFGSAVVLLFLFSGCANKDVALAAYQKGDYKTAFSIYKKWADAGYGEDTLKLAKMAQKKEVDLSNDFAIKKAKKAYESGSVNAALVLENLYIEQNDLKEAFLWMQKADMSASNGKDFENHLFLITNYLSTFKEQKEYLQKLEDLAEQNPTAAYKLGVFYAKDGVFYDINKSMHYYSLAYEDGNQNAGVAKALILIYKLHKEKEGIALLKEIAQNGNAKAFVEVGKYLYKNRQKVLAKYNTPCITCSFETPTAFYEKKRTLNALNKLYIKKNVQPWFSKAYELREPRGMFWLIQLDIDNDTLINDKTPYSGMDLNKTQSYLQATSTQFFKAKMLLAQIYTKYPQLNKYQLAKQIYYEYMEYDRLDALWHLYLYAKKFEPQNKEKENLLQTLVAENFQPAKVEMAYLNILQNKEKEHSLDLLLAAVKQNDLKAMNYLASLQAKKLIKTQFTQCQLYQKVCQLNPLNIKNDLKIASYFTKQPSEENLTKAATIYQFYADQNNSDALYGLATIYAKVCDDKRYLEYIEDAKSKGNPNALFAYDILVLSGDIEDDITQSLKRVQAKALAGDPRAIAALADAYAKGSSVVFDPQKAFFYYKELEKYNKRYALAKALNLYKQINIKHIYDNKIDTMYEELYSLDQRYKIDYAAYLMAQNHYQKARGLLETLPLEQYPQARFMLYQITHNKIYLQGAKDSNNGNMLAVYAKEIQRYSKQKALLYAFRADLCKTEGLGSLIYTLMLHINNAQTIKKIYQQAKGYPKCTLSY